MTQDAIGTARIDIVVDTDAFNAEVTRAKNIVATLGPEAEKSFAKMSAAEKKATIDMLKLGQASGKTKDEMRLLTLAARGALPEAIEVTRKAMLANRVEIAKNTVELNKYGVSAKQNAAALRGVPAQLTDIFVSLQGGQNPMTVLFQQGGQLKDMFGGTVPAVRALGTSLLGIINPITMTAAAAAVLALAWKQGVDELEGYNSAIIMTGNRAGMTVDQLVALSQSLDDLDGVTERSAAKAVTAAARTGQFTSSQLEMVATAAEKWRVATSTSVDATIAEFAKLKDDPVEAVLKLNDEIGGLTQAQLDNIISLKEQGREMEAGAAAMAFYAGEINTRAPLMAANIDQVTGAFSRLKSLAAEAWDSTINWMRANDQAIGATFDVIANQAQKRLMAGSALFRAYQASKPADFSGVTASVSGQKMAGSSKDVLAAEQALAEFNRKELSYLDDAAKKKREIADVNSLLTKQVITQEQATKRIAQIESSYAEKAKKAAGSGSKTNPANAIIDRLQKQISLTDAQGLADEKLSTVQKMRLDIEVELARLGAKVAPADKAAIADLLKKAEASETLALAKVQEKKAAEDLARLQAQYSQDEQNQRRANEIDLMGIGRGGNAAEMLRRQLDIQRELVDGLDKIKRDAAGKTQAALLQEEAALRASIDRRLGEERTYQDKRIALMGDWRNGAVKAMEDFNAHASDVAGRTGDLFASNLQRAEDAIVQFATTGKLSIKGLLADIGSELVRFFAKQAVMQFIQAFASSWMGGTTGVGANATSAQAGGSFVGPRAKGGAFHGSAEFFAKGGAFTNSIVNRATPFAFANGGKFGVMGEAGPEAIMPLERDARGRLGVIAAGGGGGGGITFNQTNVINSDGSSKSDTTASEQNAAAKEFGNRMRAVAQEEIMRAMRDGGALRRAGVGA